MDPRREAIGMLAARQYGLVSRQQAREAGMSRSAIGRRLATGEWSTADYGVYRIAGSPVTWHQQLLGACLAGPAVASHRSAARLWGFPVEGDQRVLEVTALRHRRRHAQAVRWHESRRLEDRYIASVDRIPTTTPLRTIVDLATVLSTDQLEHSLYDSMRLRLTSIEGIERMLDDLGELRLGRGRMREVVKRARVHERPPTTTIETEFLQLLRSAGLPLPTPQVEVREADGELIGRADFAYPDQQIVIELDSSRWHSIGIDQENDMDRDRRMRDLGHRILRVSRKMLRTRPDELVEWIRLELGVPD